MYSMVCHSGVLGGGHYVSYGKTAQSGISFWILSLVSSVAEVRTLGGYILEVQHYHLTQGCFNKDNQLQIILKTKKLS